MGQNNKKATTTLLLGPSLSPPLGVEAAGPPGWGASRLSLCHPFTMLPMELIEELEETGSHLKGSGP